MLSEFFRFMLQNQGLTWVHWNMRDINYGFAMLEHRFRVLGGDPFVLPEGKKFDLARALVSIYGISYTGHPRLTTLIEKNSMTNRDFLSGEEEAGAFEKGEFVKLHQSTLRKVDVLSSILGRAADGSLKTNSKWWERSGLHPKVMVEMIMEHWVYSALTIVALVIVYALWLKDAL